ncbi:MAG: DNA polymerase IV [Gammaproteobacteria bacterium]
MMNLISTTNQDTRKIIHIDMDCFYAAIEIRDNPSLAGKPVAVGGAPNTRGVLCTCNYEARKYGVHSAMATAIAYRLCPDLVVLPVNMAKYRDVAKTIHHIFSEYTELVEPLSLDEAFLDVTHATDYHGSATLIAKAIRQQILETVHLTASAGVAPNKFLAKIASGWQKPDSLFVIRPENVASFVQVLPVEKLHGVGKVTTKKLHNMAIKTCTDLQKLSLTELTLQFGKFGQYLYEQCRGQDHREVKPNRKRKSLSVETTFSRDIKEVGACINIINALYQKLLIRLQEHASNRLIKNQYLKIKLSNFKSMSTEIATTEITLERYVSLFRAAYNESYGPIRLLGLGVHFQDEQSTRFIQQSLF